MSDKNSTPIGESNQDRMWWKQWKCYERKKEKAQAQFKLKEGAPETKEKNSLPHARENGRGKSIMWSP